MAATFGRRLRRKAASTAVAALALAALTASSAPPATESAAAREPDPTPPPIDGGSGYYADLPPLNRPAPHSPSPHPGTGPAATGPAEAGIPATVLAAYKKAEARIDAADPGCRLRWQLLAGIGKVESGQARGGAVDATGATLAPILGPQLNGHGFALIRDTDGGLLDGDRTHDRAVGPMQFIPSTWSDGGLQGAGWGADGNGDGKKDPHNVFDAALAAGRYLCAGGRDLSARADLDRAILGYNDSAAYLRTVLTWYAFYRNGTHEVPDGKGVLPARRGGPTATGGAADGRSATGHRPTAGGTKGKGASPHRTPRKPTPARPGGATGTPDAPGRPTTPPAPGPRPSPTPPRPADPAPLATLDRTGDAHLTATAGADFPTPPQVRARDAHGRPVAGATVRFTLPATTDTRFPRDATTVTVTTGKDGLATAPTLHAGERTGAFTLRARAVGRAVPAVDLAARVTARPAPRADALTRTADAPPTATAGQTFADDAVQLRATYQGKAVAGVDITATMITDDPEKPAENDKGPYFTDPHATGADKDKPVRTLTHLTTDADGLLTLPEIRTDTHTGTFLLRLTTADGARLTVELKVTPPATD
ncbi:lytic transglycosylase [Streptomyces sp. NPDC048638]|uniref:lytic transglycosylase n=1 Tax=Streptomyces sp. NPDC048638 TaxID=3365580 RepID=UPI003717F765